MKKTLAQGLEELINTPVAIMCARFCYRGILAEIGEDWVRLTNPRAVEQTGPSNNAEPSIEDPIPSDVFVSLGAVELVFVPAWASHEMET